MRKLPAVVKPRAVVLVTDAYGHEREYVSFVCKHCGCAKAVPEGRRIEDVSAVCHRCGLICARCARLGTVVVQLADGTIEEMQRCLPFERQVEMQEARHRYLRETGAFV